MARNGEFPKHVDEFLELVMGVTTNDEPTSDLAGLRQRVRSLEHELATKDAELARLGRLCSIATPSVDDVLTLLHAVVDEGVTALYGSDVAKPWTAVSARPPRMTDEQLLEMRRASIAHARASKRVGPGRGRVSDYSVKEQLEADAEELDASNDPYGR